MKIKNPEWRVRDTANYFHVSIGLASEDIKLSKLSREDPDLFLESRNKALIKLAGQRNEQ